MAEPHPHPDHLWRNPEPRRSYEVVIVGAGGHGLATAYYLAKNHGISDVAVLERGWLAGGNMARNTTVIRSNYLWDESAAIYEHSLKLWEHLSEELDYEILFSQRGVHTNRGLIAANKVAICAAGHSTVLADMIGLDLPIESHPLQALVSELLQPALNCRSEEHTSELQSR